MTEMIWGHEVPESFGAASQIYRTVSCKGFKAYYEPYNWKQAIGELLRNPINYVRRENRETWSEGKAMRPVSLTGSRLSVQIRCMERQSRCYSRTLFSRQVLETAQGETALIHL